MFGLTIFLGLALCTPGLMAQLNVSLRNEVRAARKACHEEKLNPHTVAVLKASKQFPDRSVFTEDAVCLLDCIVRKTGVVVNNQMVVAKSSEFIQTFGMEPSHVAAALDGIRKCAQDRANPTEKCSAGEYVKMCEHKYARDLSFLSLFLQL